MGHNSRGRGADQKEEHVTHAHIAVILSAVKPCESDDALRVTKGVRVERVSVCIGRISVRLLHSPHSPFPSGSPISRSVKQQERRRGGTRERAEESRMPGPFVEKRGGET